MVRPVACLSLIMALAAACASAAVPEGGLSQETASRLLESVTADAATRAAMNAVTNNSILDLALNREMASVHDKIFSLQLPTKGITDQESSGRCWLFAGLNILRQEVIHKYKLEEFELSQSYLAFWDKLEKSNVFLEFAIESRDRDFMDREVTHMFEQPADDGGYWGYVVNLVEKYGVVPKAFMGETKSSSNTDQMTGVLYTLLRRDALHLRKLAAEGKAVSQLRDEKMKMLEDVMRLLVINYGKPPASFAWRTVDDSTHQATEPRVYTPQEFYREVVGVDLSDYVSLSSFPVHPFMKHYSINLTRSMADRSDESFVNIEESQMKECALKALQDSNLVWFGADVAFDISGKRGIMAKGLFDYSDLFGIELDMTKAERLDSRESTFNHAMVLTGVDVIGGNPTRWRVENSWGTDRGDEGFFTMTDDWFDEYVLNLIVPKKYIPELVLAVHRESPTPLPVWDPMWQAMRR